MPGQKCGSPLLRRSRFCRMDWLGWPRHPFSVPHEEARTMAPVTFCGRTFTKQEVGLMRVVAHDYAGLGVTEIARTVCELLEWKRPNGGLKNHECRQLMERLEAEGVLRLPALRKLGGAGPRRVDVSEPRGEAEAVGCAASACGPCVVALVGGPGGGRFVAGEDGTLSLLGLPWAVGCALALLGAEPPAGTRLSALDLARLEDEAARPLDRLE